MIYTLCNKNISTREKGYLKTKSKKRYSKLKKLFI